MMTGSEALLEFMKLLEDVSALENIAILSELYQLPPAVQEPLITLIMRANELRSYTYKTIADEAWSSSSEEANTRCPPYFTNGTGVTVMVQGGRFFNGDGHLVHKGLA